MPRPTHSGNFPRSTDDRAAGLSNEVDELAEWIYNGNLDDQKKLRTALANLVEKGLALGYEIGSNAR